MAMLNEKEMSFELIEVSFQVRITAILTTNYDFQ